MINEKEPTLYLSNKEERDLFIKIQKNNIPFKSIASIVCGLTPYRLGKGNPIRTKNIIKTKAFDAEYKKNDTYHQYLMGRDFYKYKWQIKKERWLSYGDWLAEPRYKAPFNDKKKIIIRQTADCIIAHVDTNKYISLKNVHNVRITLSKISYEYLLGILNSNLMSFCYRQLIPEKGRVFAEVKIVNLKKLPIYIPNFDNKNDKQQHNKLVKLVNEMLKLNKNPEKNRIKILATEILINSLVYELYNIIKQDEKDIIEGKK